jgi:hypothetical protein
MVGVSTFPRLFRRRTTASDVPPVGERLTIILEEARRALDHQQADLNSLRDRAGNLLQFGGLAAGVLLTIILRGDKAVATGWTLAGALAFGVLAVLSVFILWPRWFAFSNDVTVMLGKDWNHLTPPKVAERLAECLDEDNCANAKKIKWMVWAYTIGIIAFLIEIGCLLIDLLGR